MTFNNYQDSDLKTIPISEVIRGTYIPTGIYFSKAQVSEHLNIPPSTLQYHIGKGHIKTINFPGLGHLILDLHVLEFYKTGQAKYNKVK